MKSLLLNLSLGVTLGALIWLASPMITGMREPWDSRSAYFCGALLISGFILSLASRRWFWLGLVGLYLGQLGIMLAWPRVGHSSAPWWAGALILTLFCLLAVATAIATRAIFWLLGATHRD